MRKIFMTASAVLFAVCCSNGSIVKSGSGESCNRTADCSDGLKCINFICTDLSEADNDSDDNDNDVTVADEDTFDVCGEDFCYIDGRCILDGKTDITHLCRKCDVMKNKYSWIIKPAGILCRESKNDCDVAEICDGMDIDCPENYIAGRDVPCTEDGNLCNGEEYCDGQGKCLLHINPVKCMDYEHCEESTGLCLCENGSISKIECSTDDSMFQRRVCDKYGIWRNVGTCYCETGSMKAVLCRKDSSKFQKQICDENGNWLDEGICFDPFYPVLCTGQAYCYGNDNEEILCPSDGEGFYGQDAQYMNMGYCIPKRFSIKYSGLIPEKIIVDLNTGFQWQGILPEIYEECKKDTLCEFGDALDYCESLVYGGYEDWRLPKDDEMMTVINYGKTGPAYDEMYFPSAHTYFFWSHVDNEEGFSKAIMADINGSFHRPYYSEPRGTVMCIRNAQIPKHLFSEETVNGVTVVTDSVTGLQWTKGVFSEKTWIEALNSCENLEYAGYTDWRLPNINELAGLIDRKKDYCETDFPGLSVQNLISSTSYLSDTVYAWSVELMEGSIDGRLKDSGSYDVICVR